MKNLFKNVFNFIKQPLPAVLFGVLIILLIINAVAFSGNNLENYDTEIVVLSTVVQEVDVTGRIEPAQELELSLERGGRIVSAPVIVGENVIVGELLVAVSSGTLGAQQAELQAALEREEIRLAQLQNQSGGFIAGATIENARNNLSSTLRTSFVLVDSALAANVDQFYSDARTNPDFQGRFTTSAGTSLFIKGIPNQNLSLVSLRREINKEMEVWALANQMLQTDTNLLNAAKQGGNTINIVDKLLTNIAQLLATRSGDDPEGRSIYTSLRTEISTARTSVNAARSNIVSAEQLLNSARSGVSGDEVRLQEIAVRQARARLQAVNAQLTQGTIRSPISGTITKQEAHVGEFVSAARPIVTVASGNMFEIEMFVPEADIAKVTVGDSAKVTLDAFDSDREIPAEVVFIDPAETLTEGIASFKVTLLFTDGADITGIKPGMTADIEVLTGTKENVIAVPQRSVIEEDGRTFIRVIVGETIHEINVTTGLRGSNGTIEITSGISEGDRIIVFERD